MEAIVKYEWAQIRNGRIVRDWPDNDPILYRTKREARWNCCEGETVVRVRVTIEPIAEQGGEHDS